MSGWGDIPPEELCVMPDCDRQHDTVVAGFRFCVTHAEEVIRELLFGKETS